MGLKKGKDVLFFGLSYGFFLSISITSTAPIMTITTIIATTPYITVLFEAKPVSGSFRCACIMLV